MPTDERFGPLLSLQRPVSDGIMTTLQFRERQYVAAAERDAGWTPGMIAPVKSWNASNRLDAIPGGENTPAVILAVRGAAGPPRRSGRGLYSIPLGVGLAVVAMGQDQDNSREVAGVLGAAFLGIILHHKTFGDALGGRVSLQEWTDYRLDDLPPEDQRTRAIARFDFEILVKDVAQDGIGARIPDPPVDPVIAPGPLHRAEQVQINVQKEGGS
jgi:hypothetical protein